MKKFFKILGLILLTIIVILYLLFLFLIPRVVDIEQYKGEIQKIVKEQTTLDLEFSDIKPVTTPFLGVGFKAENIKLTLPDTSSLFVSDSIKVTVSLPSLLFFAINISDVEVEKPFINIEILKNGEDYKLVKLIENILNDKKSQTFGEKQEESTSGFDLSSFKIIVPNIKFNNYKVLVTDLGTNHYLDLHGDKLTLGYFDGKRIKVKTNAELFSDENKNITANLDINTFLPAPAPKLDSEDDPAEIIDFPFVNPVSVYQRYDLKTNIDTKIKLNKSESGEITSFGHINIDNLTMKLSDLEIPESYIRLKTFGTNVNVDTNIQHTKEENINIHGSFNYGKFKNADLKIKTKEIKFSDILEISKAFLNSLQIPNELNQYSANGSLTADCSIKTDFKKLHSEGYLKIQNGALSVKNSGEILSDANINLILDNNILDIKESGLFINNSEVKINGFIDKQSFTNVDIITEKLPVAQLFKAFAPKKIREVYDLKSGELSSHINIQGKMKEAVSKINLELENLDLFDIKNSFEIKNKNFNTSLVYDAKTLNIAGEVNNKDFEFIIQKTYNKIFSPKLKININNKNIEVEHNTIKFNDKSTLVYSGKITNYENPETINFILEGNLNTNDIIRFIGEELKPFIHSKGDIPVKMTFDGNSKKQTLFIEALADNSNFITPVDFSRLKDLKTTLQATVDFKPARIKIKDTGLFTRAYMTDENGKEVKVLNKFLGIDGTIEGDTINILKIDIPKDIAGKIYAFPQSQYVINQAKVYLYGKVISPLFKGDLRISDISIPEILTSISKINLNFKETDLNFNVEDVQMSGSDINIRGKYSLIPDSISNIYDFILQSNNINIEEISTVSEKIMQYVPQTSSNKSSSYNDIPVIVHNGSVDINHIQTGNIELFNTKSDLTLNKNILDLNRLSTDIFNGSADGNIRVNLLSMMINANLIGRRINVGKALLDSSGIKDSLSGTLDFTSKLLINAGAKTPEEQIKGIDGNIDFNIVDGQFGPFGKLENLILAENIRESEFFKSALGGIIESIATIDTTHFNKLNGHADIKDGMCYISPLTSFGNVMNLHINGNFDILKNYTDMKVRIKITSLISNLLGPLNAINPVNLVNSAASLNVVTAKAFSIFCETLSEEELEAMPKFSNDYIDSSSAKFQIVVRGDVAKPFTLIKSFKWLATQMQFAKAKEFADSLPEPTEESTATNIEEAIEEAKRIEAEKKTLKYKIKHIFKRREKEKTQEEE